MLKVKWKIMTLHRFSTFVVGCVAQHMVDRFSSCRDVPSNLPFIFFKDNFAL
jgi:hypothetical protein